MTWTAKGIELRVIDAAETLLLCPGDYRSMYDRSWPAYVREASESYGWHASTYRRRPSPQALDRMYETWGWINSHNVESERKLLYAWGWHKVARGLRVSDLATKTGIKSRTLRWEITRICKGIADRLNMQMYNPCTFDTIAENLVHENPDSMENVAHRSDARATYIRSSDAIPRHLPDHPDNLALIRRLERHRQKRAKSARG